MSDQHPEPTDSPETIDAGPMDDDEVADLMAFIAEEVGDGPDADD